MKRLLVIACCILSFNFFMLTQVMMDRHSFLGVLTAICCAVWAMVAVVTAFKCDVTIRGLPDESMGQPAIVSFTEVVAMCDNEACNRTPLPFHSKLALDAPQPTQGWLGRLQAAWMVFTGKADALVWPKAS